MKRNMFNKNWKDKWFPRKLRKLHKLITPKSALEKDLAKGQFTLAPLIRSIMPESEMKKSSDLVLKNSMFPTQWDIGMFDNPPGFLTDRQKNKIGMEWHRGHRYSNTFGKEISCKLCGTKFVNDYKHRIYCGVECRIMFNRLYSPTLLLSKKLGNVGFLGLGKNHLENKNCLTCKKQFLMKTWKQKYCSRKCRVSDEQYKRAEQSMKLTCKICGYRVMGGEQRSLKINAGCCYLCARKLKRAWGIDQMRPRKDTAKSNFGDLRKRY